MYIMYICSKATFFKWLGSRIILSKNWKQFWETLQVYDL